VLGVGHGLACLVEAGESHARVIATTLQPAHGDVDVCGLMSCAEWPRQSGAGGACSQKWKPRAVAAAPGHRAPLRRAATGNCRPQEELAPWQTQLLMRCRAHIGIAIAPHAAAEQSAALSLLEERAALARELHDRWRSRCLHENPGQPAETRCCLRPALVSSQQVRAARRAKCWPNCARSQQRLPPAARTAHTFRLRIEGRGAGGSLETTVAEFSSRGNIPIALEAHLAAARSAQRRNSCLQNCGEALSNAAQRMPRPAGRGQGGVQQRRLGVGHRHRRWHWRAAKRRVHHYG